MNSKDTGGMHRAYEAALGVALVVALGCGGAAHQDPAAGQDPLGVSGSGAREAATGDAERPAAEASETMPAESASEQPAREAPPRESAPKVSDTPDAAEARNGDAPSNETESPTQQVESLLDPRYDDEVHLGACPTVEQDADMDTLVTLLGGAEYMGAERYQRMSMREGPLNVAIGVAGGADYSRVGDIECPPDGGRSCPERDQARAEAAAISLASQRCVHELVETLGGEVTETFSLGNAFSASLTWAQLLRIAAHPHVQSISDNEEVTPPP